MVTLSLNIFEPAFADSKIGHMLVTCRLGISVVVNSYKNYSVIFQQMSLQIIDMVEDWALLPTLSSWYLGNYEALHDFSWLCKT